LFDHRTAIVEASYKSEGETRHGASSFGGVKGIRKWRREILWLNYHLRRSPPCCARHCRVGC